MHLDNMCIETSSITAQKHYRALTLQISGILRYIFIPSGSKSLPTQCLTGYILSEVMRPGLESEQSSPHSIEVLNAWNFTIFLYGAVLKGRDNFTFTFLNQDAVHYISPFP